MQSSINIIAGSAGEITAQVSSVSASIVSLQIKSSQILYCDHTTRSTYTMAEKRWRDAIQRRQIYRVYHAVMFSTFKSRFITRVNQEISLKTRE